MKLDVQNWKPFITSQLFPVMENGKANQQMLDEGNECFYVGAKKDDNGVMLHCQRDESLITKGNCIVFICNGQGSVGFANYMDVDFIGTTDIVAGYNEHLNEYTGVFLATVYSQERPKYSFGRKWKTHLSDTEVKLPADVNGNPDWQFMEEYIKSLHHEPLTTKNKTGQARDLNVSEWKEFRVTEIFTAIEPGKISNASDLEEGQDIPYLGAKKDNNGMMQMCVDVPEKRSRGNCVIMICDGEGSVGLANYMESDFLGTVNLMLGYNDTYLNPFTGLFVATVLSQERPKYSFGRKWKTHISETTIKLPADADGNPDWQFMEDYIKSLPYGDRLADTSP